METVPKGPTGMRKTHCQNNFFYYFNNWYLYKKRKEKFHELVYYGCTSSCLMYTCMTNNQFKVWTLAYCQIC